MSAGGRALAREDLRLVALDLDGTLTQHKSGLDAACRAALDALARRYKLLMVCAGGCERVFRQMGGFPADISGWYGMQFSTVENGRMKLLENHTIPADRAGVTARAEALRRELGFTEYAGEGVEFHASGMVTFPLLGTEAPLADKLAFDPDRSRRRRGHARVREAFPEYTVFVGGTSSFDMAPRPFSKLFALDACLARYGLARAQAVYFGDGYGPGGNDEDVFASDVCCVRVDDYRDFPALAERLLMEEGAPESAAPRTGVLRRLPGKEVEAI